MKAIPKMNSYALQPVGFIRSTVKGREDAPRQGTEGAPDAWLEIEPRFAEALLGMEVGHELVVITWLHEAKRDVLKGHPRNGHGVSRHCARNDSPARIVLSWFRDRRRGVLGPDGFANRWLVGSGSVYETASKMACRIRLRSWDYWRIERSESGYSSGVVSNSVDAISWIRLAHCRGICLAGIDSIGAANQ